MNAKPDVKVNVSENANKVSKLTQEMSIQYYDNVYKHHLMGDETCLTEDEHLNKMEFFKTLDK